MANTAGLVPDSFEDFRSQQFWEGFFKSRGDKPFEWYGDWRQLQPLLRGDCRTGRKVLIVGCGNSELSAELYDSGCQQITNIDFSKLAIASMMRKNLRQRPRMKWQVMDMTALKFTAMSFEVVVDKGSLDALMGEDSAASTEAGGRLLREVERVLTVGGSYLCVTLAQSHVLRLLLDTLRHGWKLELRQVPPSPDMARSPLQPILVRAVKEASADEMPPYIAFVADRSASSPNAEQLADIAQIVSDENEARQRTASPAGEDFDRLHPGQRVSLPLQRSLKARSTAGTRGANGAVETPRFTAVVMDAAGRMADAAYQQCCVFIVPQGRDSEWLFASEEGQWQVAGQCGCRRVILVALSRGHTFGPTAAVQAELSPLVEPLAPLDLRGVPGAIPIMTTQEGVGSRSLLEVVDSAVSGQIVVEDVALPGPELSYARRMVFVSNSNLIQSEARLRPLHQPGSAAGSQGQGKKKRGKPASQHAGAVTEPLQLDHSILGMEYHKAVVAGISLISEAMLSRRREGAASSGCALVIGLGGGGLPVFLHRFLGMSVEAVELDEAVVGLARRHFGFQEESGLQAAVGDGLVALAAAAESNPGSLDLLVVDAGSGDASLAMSCPPAAFLEQPFLRNACTALRPGGLLAVNCVTRLDATFLQAAQAVQEVFGATYEANIEDDVNRVLFGIKGDASEPPSQKPTKGLRQLFTDSMQIDIVDEIADQLSALQLLQPGSQTSAAQLLWS